MTHEEEFQAYMKAVTGRMSNDETHLTEARMIAYCRGELSDAEREVAQDHLTGCEQCVALFRSARDFVDPADPGEIDVNAAETEAAWNSFLERVHPGEVSESNVVRTDFSSERKRKFPGDSRLTYPLAASLLISFSVLGLLGWRLRQEQKSRQQSQQAAVDLANKQRELEQRLSQVEQSGADQIKREREQRLAAEAERDQLQSLLASVQPERAVIPVFPFTLSAERGSGEDLSLSFKKGVQTVRLMLFQSKPYAYQQYAVELVDGNGRVVQAASRLRPAAADGALFVLLKRTSFVTGNYKLRLFGLQGNTRQQLGEYGVNVTAQ